ncbi:MAG: MFS transporter [Dehalococcoidia bacterium]
MNAPEGLPTSSAAEAGLDYSGKWKAFSAIAISFVTMVMSISMVFVALSAIADDFGITLRAVTWVVVVQALTISALMMPMGRLADIVGWKRIHLIGLLLFGGGSVFVALAPTFGLLIVARVVMAAGSAMGQSVGTAMVVSVFPPTERGMAIGSQTTAVAIGGASGPVVGGLVLQVLPWEALFLMIVVPIGIAFVAGFLILDEKRMRREERPRGSTFDWFGALLSAIAVIILVITINNPLGLPWASPAILGSLLSVVLLLAVFVRWELRSKHPMLELRLFRNTVVSLSLIARLLGFMGATASRFLMPVYLISLRGMEAGAAGSVLFLTSLGMGLAAQASGRLSDRFGSRPFAVLGFALLLLTSVPMALLESDSALPFVALLLFVNGLGTGLWGTPNSSVILGSVPPSSLGVVAALTNLTRNIGNVFGQAIASGVVVAVMAAGGFDIPLSEVGNSPAAAGAFIDGWRVAFLLVAVYAVVGLVLALATKPSKGEPAPATPATRRAPGVAAP